MLSANNIKKISQNPGVYIFKDKAGRILYIGKATNLRSRVGSYFRGLDLTLNPSPSKGEGNRDGRPVMSVLGKVAKIETRETESVLEALILESNLIKKHQPKYNVDLKDDKSFSYVVITKEEFPRVLIVRETELLKFPISNFQFLNKSQFLISKLSKNKQVKKQNLKANSYKLEAKNIFGPYTSKKQLEVALKIIRKIFPYHSRKEKSEKGCLDFQIGLCPGPYAGEISKTDYKNNIRNIRMILSGNKKNLVSKLKKEMKEFSLCQEFEKAGEVRNQVFALRHIRDVALISFSRDENFKFQISNFQSSPNLKNSNFKIDSKFKIQNSKFRIEAYDISNISGRQAVGSMVVFEGGEANKKEYRKFRVKTVEGANDVAMMAEVLFRRFRNDWKKPDLILLDGGKGHLNMAEKVLKELGVDIPLVGVAKGPTRKISNFQFLISKQFPITKFQKELLSDKNFIGSIIEEAHRFALKYHKKVRKREFIEK